MPAHDPSFGERLLADYLHRPLRAELRERIDQDGSRPVLVCGPSGSGKTSVLAGAVQFARKAGFDPIFVAVASQAGTSTLRGLAEHLCDRLAHVVAGAAEERRPGGSDDCREAVRRLVSRVPADRPVAIVVDDIDRLEPIYDSLEMEWLPRQLPPQVLWICSCDERSRHIADSLRYADRIELSPRKGAALGSELEVTFDELEGRYGAPAVGHVASLVACARIGLNEGELHALTAGTVATTGPADLFPALRPFLRSSRDVVHFAHHIYVGLTLKRYVRSPVQAADIHRRLASFFSASGWSERMIDEAFWHWTQARDRAQIEALLCNPWFVEQKCRVRGIGEVEDDYERAITAFSSPRIEQASEHYLSALVDYARRRTTEESPPSAISFPSPPASTIPLLQPRENAAPDPEPRLVAFQRLFLANRELLRAEAACPGIFFQSAYNDADPGIRDAAAALLDGRPTGVPLLLRRHLDPTSSAGERRWDRIFEITADHRHILSHGSSEMKCINIWDPQTGRRTMTLQRKDGQYDTFATTPDGKRLLAGGGPGALYGRSEDYALHMWDLSSGQLLGTWQGHHSDIGLVVVTINGRWCITGARRAGSSVIGSALSGRPGAELSVPSLRVWDLADGSSTTSVFVDHRINQLALAPDGRLMALLEGSDSRAEESSRRNLRLVDRWTGRDLGAVPDACDYLTRALCISPDGRRMIWFTADYNAERKELHVLDLRSNVHQAFPQVETLESIAVTPDCRHLVTIGRESYDRPPRIRVLDLAVGHIVAVARAVASEGLALRGHWCVVSGRDGNGAGDDLHILDIVGLSSGPAAVTAVRRFRHDTTDWDDVVTAFCDWCGHLFPVPPEIRREIALVQERFDSNLPPCLAIWQSTWRDEVFEMTCPSCREPLRFNPFIVDER